MTNVENKPGTAVELYRHGPFTTDRLRRAHVGLAQSAVDIGLSLGLGIEGRIPLRGVIAVEDKQKPTKIEAEEPHLRFATWEDFAKADEKARAQRIEFAVHSQLYEEQVASLTDFVRNAGAGDVAFLIGDRGSGKTHVLWALIERLIAEGICRREDIARYTGIINSSANQPEHPTVVVIDEFDQAFSPDDSRTDRRFQKISEQFRGRLDSPIVIFAGSKEELRYPEFIAQAGIDLEAVYEVEIPHLTKDIFLEAMSERLRFSLGSEAATIDVGSAFDKEFLHWLIPNTNPQIATLLGALNSIGPIINNGLFLPPSSGAIFSLDTLRRINEYVGRNEFKRMYEDFDPGLQDLLNWLQSYILMHHSRTSSMGPLTVQDIMMGVLGDADNADTYRAKYIPKLMLYGLIKSVNPDEFNRRDKETEGPFLPTQQMFLYSRSEQRRLPTRIQLALPAGPQPKTVEVVLSEREGIKKDKARLLDSYNYGEISPEHYRDEVRLLNERLSLVDKKDDPSLDLKND